VSKKHDPGRQTIPKPPQKILPPHGDFLLAVQADTSRNSSIVRNTISLFSNTTPTGCVRKRISHVDGHPYVVPLNMHIQNIPIVLGNASLDSSVKLARAHS
jgi:hypothetical protein